MRKSLDIVGMALSIGCMIHCLLMPIIIPMLPALGFVFGHDSYTHLILATIITVVAAIALVPGYLKHKNPGPLILATVGIITIVCLGIAEHTIDHPAITIMTVLGSLIIALAHYINHTQICSCKHHD